MLSALVYRLFFCCSAYTSCLEINISDIFDCNLNKDYQILVIFNINISDTTGDQMTVQCVSLHALFVSALFRKTKSTKYCIFILFCLFRFSQVVQKQIFNEVKNRTDV